MGRTGGIGVRSEDIIDIIDGYKAGGSGVSTRQVCTLFNRTGVIEVFEGGIQLCINC